ncbi:serine/arginine-rich splicing factor SC35-like [Lotus japonicus]|uniref:serine/arginine-rich splicing factor SC35-like n=1 Tax=Lotus japonicus TaxID=34305 RepID=UPI00258AEAD8|nr:serine/arginine-rich splicing factor SC35-like [Lotus japonicus]
MPPESSDQYVRRRGGVDGKPGFSVFVDGLGDEFTYQGLKDLGLRYGRVLGVFIQRVQRQGRKARFGFVRFKYKIDADTAVQELHGALVDNSILVVNREKYEIGMSGKRRASEWRPKGKIAATVSEA